jgi:FAD:protein FMN transferase
MTTTRRRFLTIAAACALAPTAARAVPVHVETAVALGARVTLRLEHPDAPALAAAALAEIRRLEGVFSLYRPDSALVQLNATGRLDLPPPELLDCLTLAGAVHRMSDGAFDPTVQPLWLAEAAATTRGAALTVAERGAAQAHIGWHGVALSAQAITLGAGQALTLNGIAQGYIADRVAALLAARGLTRALIDTGEMVALPDGTWPVGLPDGARLPLTGRALATSAPLGMTFGADGRRSHILDPRTGAPVAARWQSVSISAPSAALADALSTAACLMPDSDAVGALCRGSAGARVELALPA